MKIISLNGENKFSFFKEIRLFKSLNCEFIIKLYDHFSINDSIIGTGYLITEYCRVKRYIDFVSYSTLFCKIKCKKER
jgi:serine/threonine protein kinase